MENHIFKSIVIDMTDTVIQYIERISCSQDWLYCN